MTLAPALVALAWTLIHSLWQAALIAGVVALVRAGCTRAELRYALCFGGALATLAASLVTYLLVYPWGMSSGAGEAALLAALVAEGSSAALLGAERLTSMGGSAGERWLAGLLLAWSAGASFMAARMMLGLAAVARLRRTATVLEGRWARLVGRLRVELGIPRPVGLAESRSVDSPLVVGVLRPLILVPLGMVHRLSAESVEAALLHELVHVRRHDYLMGLALALVETLYFFHPAIWWMSRRAREEREHCCDDGVVHHTGDALRYALALTDLEALRGELAAPSPPTLGPAAVGGELMSRIQRIIDHRAPVSTEPAAAAPARSGPNPNLWMPMVTLAAALAVTATVVPACMEDDAVAAEAAAEELRGAAEEGTPVESADTLAVGASDGPHEEGGEELSIAWCDRLAPYAPEIKAAAERHGVDPELVAIVTLLESDGDPSARSSHGARGLMQLMPQTAATIAERRGLDGHSEERLDDPAYNLDLGAYHLAELLEDFAPEGEELSAESVELVAAAYNGGAPRVRAYLAGDAELSAETARYKDLVRDLWSERDQPASATLDGLRSR